MGDPYSRTILDIFKKDLQPKLSIGSSFLFFSSVSSALELKIFTAAWTADIPFFAMITRGHNFQFESTTLTEIMFPYLHITYLHFLPNEKLLQTVLIIFVVIYNHTVMLILKELNLAPCMLSL